MKPRDAVFDEAWHAQVLALADTMVQSGIFSAKDWAAALGEELELATTAGKPDHAETYYHGAIAALEKLTTGNTQIGNKDLKGRKDAWTRAYAATPHGQPIVLGVDQS